MPMAVKVINLTKKIPVSGEIESKHLAIELDTLMSCNNEHIIKCYGAFYKNVALTDEEERGDRARAHGLGDVGRSLYAR